MKFFSIFASLAVTCMQLVTCRADVYLSQDFNSSNNVADYVSATPGIGQFNGITTSGPGTVLSITNNALQFARTSSNAGSMTRLSLDTSPISTALVTMNLNVLSSGSQTTAAVFQLGDNFLSTTNSPAINANTHSRIGLNFGPSNSFSFRNIGSGANSAVFFGPQTVTWAVNNSGSNILFLAPGATQSTLLNDTAQLFVGNTLALTINAQTASQVIDDFKFTLTEGTGTVAFDSISIQSISAVPEPTSLTLFVVVGAAGIVCRGIRRKLRTQSRR